MKILLSAFACDPLQGSEPNNGWNWATGIAARGHETHCFTRDTGREGIRQKKPGNLHFHYVVLPLGLEKLYSYSTASMYLYYLLWQWSAYRKAKKLHRKIRFSLAHHVTWGSLQMGSFMYRINIPFLFGPAGGGQTAPPGFKKYFREYWSKEEKREVISRLMLKHNPGCKKMLQKALAVLVANTDTFEMAKQNGASNVSTMLDFALPESFFPEEKTIKQPAKGKLKLLWVGRFLPRKGSLLILDVMNELKNTPGITLTVVGDGDMKDHFRKQLDEYALTGTVNWVGKVPYEKVREYYATHDVFFFTSLRDSCPVQLMEAMAFGMPVVTLNLHGQAMIVNDETGIRCDCDTPETAIAALKKALLYLYHNPETVSKMSAAATVFAARQTWTNKINQIVNQYYPAP